MKRITVALAALLAAVALPAAAAGPAKKPLGQWSCEEYLAVSDQIKPKVVYWATAYGKGGKPEAAVLDIDATETVTPAIIDACSKSPKASFWQTVKSEWAKVENAASRDAKAVGKAASSDAKALEQAASKDAKAVEKATAKDAKALEKDAGTAAKKVEKAM